MQAANRERFEPVIGLLDCQFTCLTFRCQVISLLLCYFLNAFVCFSKVFCEGLDLCLQCGDLFFQGGRRDTMPKSRRMPSHGTRSCRGADAEIDPSAPAWTTIQPATEDSARIGTIEEGPSIFK